MLQHLIENEKFEHHFQPLFNLNSKTKIGYEALFRSKLFKSPELAFNEAKKENRLYDLDIKSIKKAVATSHKLEETSPTKLFLNVFPSNLIKREFLNFLDELKSCIPKQLQVVLEINEAEMIFDFNLMKKRIQALKERGFLFALDDVGKGSSTLLSLIELNPDYIKMDKYFSNKLSKSVHKQQLIKSFINYCEGTKSELILEGIDEKEDMETAVKLGVSYGQGYFLGKPAPVSL